MGGHNDVSLTAHCDFIGTTAAVERLLGMVTDRLSMAIFCPYTGRINVTILVQLGRTNDTYIARDQPVHNASMALVKLVALARCGYMCPGQAAYRSGTKYSTSVNAIRSGAWFFWANNRQHAQTYAKYGQFAILKFSSCYNRHKLLSGVIH